MRRRSSARARRPRVRRRKRQAARRTAPARRRRRGGHAPRPSRAPRRCRLSAGRSAVTRQPVRARAPSRSPSAAGSAPVPPSRLRAISESRPLHTRANRPIPQPADSSESSAVARCAAHARIASTAGRQWPEELPERALVLEGQRPGAHVRGRLARRRRRDAPIAGHRALQPHARRRERGPLPQRQRQPERVGLHPAAREHGRADRHAHQAARHRHGLERALARQRVHQRPGRRKQVRAVVHPVRTARIGAHPAAETVPGLEQQYVAFSQPPRRREPGDPAADDHHVSSLGAHQGHYRRRCVPKVGLAAWPTRKLSL